MSDIDSIKSNLFVAMQCIENIYTILAKDEGVVCDHPPERRIDNSTMGNITWTCGVCGYVYKEEGGEC